MNIQRFPGWAAVAASSLGILLHACISFFEADGGPDAFTLGLLAWAAVPYAICLLIAFAGKGRPLHGFCGAMLALVADLVLYHSVFVSPASSTAALGLLFSPLLGVVLWVPLGVLSGYAIRRWSARRVIR